jgi:hypothetical protein
VQTRLVDDNVYCNGTPNEQVLVVFAIMALAAGMVDANLPLESGRSRGDEHTAAGAEAGLGGENDARLPVGTSGGGARAETGDAR